MDRRNRQVQGRRRFGDLDRRGRAGQQPEPVRVHPQLRRDLDGKGEVTLGPNGSIAGNASLSARMRGTRGGDMRLIRWSGEVRVRTGIGIVAFCLSGGAALAAEGVLVGQTAYG